MPLTCRLRCGNSSATGPRIRHSERASKTRCYNDILLTSADDVDDELLGWIGQSYLRTSR